VAAKSMTLKETVETAQAIVTISAVFVGGIWSYNVFVKERHEYPHANMEQKLSHVTLSEKTSLLRVGAELTNAGNSLMKVGQSIVRVQQILPSLPCPSNGGCAAKEVDEAIKKVERQGDHFTWPLIAERKNNFSPPF
jgi:hypothetical protein